MVFTLDVVASNAVKILSHPIFIAVSVFHVLTKGKNKRKNYLAFYSLLFSQQVMCMHVFLQNSVHSGIDHVAMN